MSEDPNQAPNGDNYTLYVLFHGLWAFEARRDKIFAHTPIEEEHDFVAGYFDYSNPKEPMEVTRPLTPGTAYLVGVNKGKSNSFDPLNNVIVQKAALIKPQKRFCVVELPLPDYIKSVRNVSVGPSPRYPFAGKVGERLHPRNVSMVQVFIYSVKNIEDVSLQPCNARPYPNHATRTAKLHVFAEPRMIMGPFHVRDAYSKLTDLFNLDIIPIAALYVDAVDPNIPGLNLDDTKTLTELMVKQSVMVGESGSNCDALVIDNVELSESH